MDCSSNCEAQIGQWTEDEGRSEGREMEEVLLGNKRCDTVRPFIVFPSHLRPPLRCDDAAGKTINPPHSRSSFRIVSE